MKAGESLFSRDKFLVFEAKRRNMMFYVTFEQDSNECELLFIKYEVKVSVNLCIFDALIIKREEIREKITECGKPAMFLIFLLKYQTEFNFLNEHNFRRISREKSFYKSNTIFSLFSSFHSKLVSFCTVLLLFIPDTDMETES